MQHKYLRFFGLVALLLIASACGKPAASGNGSQEGVGTPGTATPIGTQSTTGTPQLPSPTPSTFPAQTPQNLSIHTDHSSYRPTDTITVTVTNTFSIPLYAWDTRASCTIFNLDMLAQGQQWQQASTAQCSLGRPALMVTLAPGQQYSASIQAQTPGLNTATFSPGTYRITLLYSATPDVQTATTQAISASFQVQN